MRLPDTLQLFDNTVKTIVFNERLDEEKGNTTYSILDFSKDIVPQLLEKLHKLNVLSLIIEGGKQTLESFIQNKLWDEAHIYTGEKTFGQGISAPKISGIEIHSEKFDFDQLQVLKRN